MALKITSPPFTIFAPPPCGGARSTSITEVRFSRWNNANAQRFTEHKRTIKEIEDDIRITRRYESVSKIIENSTTSTSTTTTNGSSFATTKSIGTPSAPSRSSIPGRRSKYSKDPKPKPKYSDPDDDDDSFLEENPNPNPVDSNLEQKNPNPVDSNLEQNLDPNPRENQNRNPRHSHPAFRKVSRVSKTKIPVVAQKHVKIGVNGVSYRIPNAPFEFQYSYTETPKVKPVALREQPFIPFGPSTMRRPWTGKAPLPGTKKRLPEFDSFRLPPPHKKGVKPVQAPGPFLAGSGPKYVKSREEILGEPLTKLEKLELVQGSAKSKRQLNMGRDGLTHNMLENIHALWKRRRVCKIKCLGVCTVDMDNIFQQLEEKTGGKIIWSKGGVIYLFRGRNYNYMTRPRYPLMLWKPVAPVYPRLIKHAPNGLLLEEANAMRKRGRNLLPICKLGKNGVYSRLVSHVREAFEVCELVRINCQGMNASDYKKIAAKLKDLVPCVLLSFEGEHILMWRGRDWTPSTKLVKESKKVDESEMTGEIISTSNSADSVPVEHQDASALLTGQLYNKDLCLGKLNISMPLAGERANVEGSDVLPHSASNDKPSEPTDTNSIAIIATETSTLSGGMWTNDDDSKASSVFPMVTSENDSATILESLGSTDDNSEATLASPRHFLGHIPASDSTMNHAALQVSSEGLSSLTECTKSSSACTEGVLQLREKAIETGNAVILDDASLDANIVYHRAVALAKVAPPGPIFMRNTPKKVLVKKREKQESEDLNVEAIVPVSGTRSEKKSSRNFNIKHLKEVYPELLPHGNLGVDELAKLLA